ncbi:nucleotide sugar dehydrogenase [uncultured Succiniclasticum sp.]|uniref:nucleotide sugar dehydrogenase n=1 Tax=uncultured Succiniclasticum sp. TaxID=1500547 RepID=UPI0025D42BAF|nr:nucleotide sugar dehydrogenase [uncultured Succiniclasticum sp.]
MKTLETIRKQNKKVAVVGLGYVGLPLALEFAKQVPTIGFDINKEKLALYRKGIDPTKEAGDKAVKNTTLRFTDNPAELKDAAFVIVAVPTPVTEDNMPDLSPVTGASELVGKNISRDTIVCYESTVYPGVTENICAPILERESGLVCGKEFKVAYSPERINPGDKEHRVFNICKIVSGMDEETLKNVAEIYSLIIKAGVYQAESIKVAEAAKLVENAQRDINIAFMNELSLAFSQMGIDTHQVINAMDTKWNALGFRPGLVGGHCIGVDPYYFLYEAQRAGYTSEIIRAGRRINNVMARYVARSVVRNMIQADLKVKNARVYLYGITFKENCPDVRNSKALDVCKNLLSYGIDVKLVDPCADLMGLPEQYEKLMVNMDEVKDADALVFVVAHDAFKKFDAASLASKYKREVDVKVLADVKCIFDKKELLDAGFLYWSL